MRTNGVGICPSKKRVCSARATRASTRRSRDLFRAPLGGTAPRRMILRLRGNLLSAIPRFSLNLRWAEPAIFKLPHQLRDLFTAPALLPGLFSIPSFSCTPTPLKFCSQPPDGLNRTLTSLPDREDESQKNKEPQAPFGTWGSSTLAMSYSRTTFRCTTIGAAAFHFRVRNGNGWYHCARITRRLVKPKLARGGKGAVSLQLHQKFWRPWVGKCD
jgi:hypothetical protein